MTANLDPTRADALSETAAQLNAAVVDLEERRRDAHAEARRWRTITETKRHERTSRNHGVMDTRGMPLGERAVMHDPNPLGPEQAAESEAEHWTATAARLDAEYQRALPRWHEAQQLADRCAAYLKNGGSPA